jgi:hypothetical protein
MHLFMELSYAPKTEALERNGAYSLLLALLLLFFVLLVKVYGAWMGASRKQGEWRSWTSD